MVNVLRGGGLRVISNAVTHNLFPSFKNHVSPIVFEDSRKEWREIIADKPANDFHAKVIKLSKVFVGVAMGLVVAAAATEDCSSAQSCAGAHALKAVAKLVP